MPNKNALWTLRESQKHGLTSELLDQFRARASADRVETVAALVRLMREYIAGGFRSETPPKEENRKT